MKMPIFVVSALSVIAAPVAAQPRYSGGNEPVTLKAMDDLDPCGYGVIADQGPEGAVNVYEGPSLELEPFDYLPAGQVVWICEATDDESMLGVVYSSDPDIDCEVGSPVAEDTDYMGPCSSGWVVADAVEYVAG